MRSPRTTVAVLALALAASMGLSPSSASARVDLGATDARPSADRVAVSTSFDSGERAAAITVTAKVVKRRLRPNGPRRLVLQGAVNPPKGPVYIQRGTKCNRTKTEQTGTLVCNWKFYRKTFVKQGRYAAGIDAPSRLRGWTWRAKVKKTVSEPWVTCTRRPGQECKVPF